MVSVIGVGVWKMGSERTYEVNLMGEGKLLGFRIIRDDTLKQIRMPQTMIDWLMKVSGPAKKR